MKLFHLKRIQHLPISIDEAWTFFSSPDNLKKITPSHMGFEILYHSGGKEMYPGQIIRYKINILPLVTAQWVTEITHVREKEYFVDEQRSGPYAMWHHEHRFKPIVGGIEMTDELNYAIPLGWLGELTNSAFVGRKVNAIFDYREEILKNEFVKR